MAVTLGLMLAVTGCNNGETPESSGPPVKARVDDAQAEIAGGAVSC